MHFVLQVGKKVEKACGMEKVRIGRAVDVTADDLACARVAAANKIIVNSSSYNPKAGWMNPADSYDLWLKAQATGQDYGSGQFFWYWSEVNVTE